VFNVTEIEDQSFMEFKFAFDDLPMWPFVRYFIAMQIENAEGNASVPPRRSHGFGRKAFFALRTLLNGPPRRVNKKICLFSSDIYCATLKEGKYFNRLYDYYADIYPADTQIFERAHDLKHQTPRYFPVDTSIDYIDLMRYVIGKIKKLPPHDRAEVSRFVAFLKERIGTNCEMEWQTVETILYTVSRRLKWEKQAYARMLKNSEVKVAIFDGASYGDCAHIIKWCKDWKITVAEFQHGMVFCRHYAYVYSSVIQKITANYLPDYLLTFGEYWGEQICTASKIITMGHPHLEASLSKVPEGRNGILFISDGHNHVRDFISENRSAIHELTKERVVYYKPSPLETINTDEAFANVAVERLGGRTDFFECLEQVDIAVGTFSTAIFEALGAHRKVIFLDHPYVRQMRNIDFLGKIVSDGDGLIQAIEMDEKKLSHEIKNHVWESNWVSNYRHFVETTMPALGCGVGGK